MALFDAFLKLDGIEGESTDHKHKGEIQLESFSWGAQQVGSTDIGGGGGAGKVSFQDFSFTAKVGTQSPHLFGALFNGRHIKEGTLTVVNGRETETILMLSDIQVTGYKESLAIPVAAPCDRDDQNSSSNNAPTESVSLNFTKIEFKV
jgi:type VI secretion system secreted protein Hcp